MPTTDPPPITLLHRREIEARIVAPLVRAMIGEVGRDRAFALLRDVIAGLARDAGADLARELGESTLPAFATALERWKAGGALEIEILESSADRLDFNVTRCQYAEMYRALGLEDLGGSLSCRRDFALIEGFDPAVTLTRTQTIMDGATHCDFRFRAPGAGGEAADPPEKDLERIASNPD